MTKQERLHWFYTAMLVLFLGCLIAIPSIGIAIRVALKQANSDAKKIVKQELQVYDSTITKINQSQFDTIINRLNTIKKQTGNE